MDDFTLSTCDGTIDNIPASVPGYINTDLMSAGIISSNPYYRYNELELSWVTKQCWIYSSILPDDLVQQAISQSSSDSDCFLILSLENVDVTATIHMNNILITKKMLQNSFRPHSLLIPTAHLVDSKNILTITMHSTLNVALEQARKYPYDVPATENYNVWAEPSHRNFVRKTGSDMGWDWGPAYVATGLFGDITLGLYKPEGTMSSLSAHFSSLNINDKSVEIEIRVHIKDMYALEEWDVESVFDIELNGVLMDTVHLSTNARDAESYKINTNTKTNTNTNTNIVENTYVLSTIRVVGDDFHLWWPRGYGEAYLYSLDVTRRVSYLVNGNRIGSGSGNGKDTQTDTQTQVLHKRIGIRSVELIQEPIPASNPNPNPTNTGSSNVDVDVEVDARVSALYTVEPTSFYFRINNVDVFAFGANFIPIDSFQSRVTDADR